MTEATPFQRKYDITFLCPPTIATVLPENATDKTVTWSSDAPSIVDVAADGTVTAKAVGTVTVTARAANGLAVTCIVTVTVAGE